METWKIIMAVLTCLFLFWLLLKLRHKPRKVIIFEDIKKSPSGVEKTYWAGNREFGRLEDARMFARSLK